ncbi:MAG: cytochrome b N-terminal domain-containing protein [Verrucomicrobiales bacterium]
MSVPPPTAGQGIPALPPTTRLNGLLVRADRMLARLDGWIHRWLPADENPFAQTGRAANLALSVAVVSGVLMLIWYAPSVHQAHARMAAIDGRTLGGWVRALHRYSSDLAMLMIAVHSIRMLCARKFTGPRWLAWVSGVILLAIVWFIGWTGFWLVWDQPAQQVAINSMLFLDSFPIFGEPMNRLFVADRLVPSLLFFVVFFLHMLLPLMIAVGLVLHLARLSRVKLMPDPRLATALLLGLAMAAWAVPAPLDAPARMQVKAESFTVDAWYLTPLALTLRFGQVGLWLGLAATTAFAAIPWLLGRHLPRFQSPRDQRPLTPWQTSVLEQRCHACTQCVQDCPFDAVRMIARSDGKAFDSRAWVDPDRCTGCGVCVGSCDSEAMSLTWFDTQGEETRIQSAVEQQRAEWVALVAGDIDGGLAHFQAKRWEARLPGFAVEFVPTASWVRPKFVERLLHGGVRGVLIVRDAPAEAAARDGNRWIAHRLAGDRKPAFRANRAGEGRWLVVNYCPGEESRLRTSALAFQNRGAALPHPARPLARHLALVGVLLLVMAATVAPSHLQVRNPAPAHPEFVFAFKVFGDMQATATLDPAEEAKKPVHMRGRVTEKPHRQPLVVRLTIDGIPVERTFQPKGISGDGPAIDVWRRPIAPGRRSIAVEIVRGDASESLQWTGFIDALPRRLHVLTYDPADGFRIESAGP